MMLKEKKIVKTSLPAGYKKSEGDYFGFKGGIFTCALIAFLIGSARLGGSGAPVSVSFISALNPVQGLAALTGSMVSYFLNDTINDNIIEIVSMMVLAAVNGFTAGIVRKNLNKPVTYRIMSVIPGAVYFISGIIISLFFEISAAVTAAVFFRAVLCSIITHFLYTVLNEYNENGKISITGVKCLPSAVIYILLICSFCTVSFGYFNFGRTASAFVLLAFVLKFGPSAGAAVGALSSLGVILFSYDLGKSMIILACTGLLAGVFVSYGKLACAVVFIISNLLGSVIIGMPSGTVNMMTDIVIASVIFVLMPEYLYTNFFIGYTRKASLNTKLFSDRLMFASAALGDVRETVNMAAETLNRKRNEKNIADTICGRICGECRSGAFCGNDEKHRSDTYFIPVIRKLRSKGYVTENDLPDSLEFCSKKPALVSEFNRSYNAELLEKRCGYESANMRKAAAEQLSSAEEILKSFSIEACEFPYCDDILSASVKNIIDGSGAKNSCATVFFDKDNHIYIECFFEEHLTVSEEKLTEKISNAVDRELDKPELTSINKISKLCIHETAKYSVEIGCARKNGREDVSGDADNIFTDGFGNMFFIISDGMGSGSRAAVESRMTVSLLTRLLKAGIGSGAAVRLINLLMASKSSDEIFATVDLLCLNLFTGKTDIIKLGAAQTFIKTGGSVKTIESFSNPAGIISSVEFDLRTAVLKEDDSFVMLTDGIYDECFPRVRELMLSSGMTPQKITDEIITYSDLFKGTYADDKTVIAVKLTKQ